MTNRPSTYTTDEDAEQIYDTMPPRVDGIGAGTLVAKALQNACPINPHGCIDLKEAFAPALANLGAEQAVPADALDDDQYGWSFDTFNAAEDVNLPEITYRDENKLWPIIPGGSLTQIIAQAKGYKTTFYLSELFRLVAKELKAGDE